jgi:hypothetical protein
MPDTILEGDHPRIISAKFGWDWFSSFRGEYLKKISSPLFLFLAWWPSWLEVGITGHIFGRGAPKDHSTKVWLQLSQWFLRRRLKCEMLTDVRRTKSDGNSSHGLKARWANKTTKGWRVSGHVIGYIYKTGYTHVYKTAKEIIFIIYMKDKVKMFKHHVLCLLLFINTLFFSYL